MNDSAINVNNTVGQAKEFLRKNFDNGSHCPCCGQFVKLYRRKLTGAMCVALIEIYKQDKKHRGEFFHVEDHLKDQITLGSSIRGDFAKLRYWGLIEQQKSKRDDGSFRSGFYRITELGRQFVEGEVTVSSHVFLFDNKLLGKSDEQVTLKGSIGSKFNYSVLMRGVPTSIDR